jgi:hypothetical protein
MKTCRDCKQTKPLEEMQKHSGFPDGRNTLCLKCNYQRVKDWRARGKRNSAAESKRYYDKYPWKGVAKIAAYNARKKQACPSWTDLDVIEKIYAGCPDGHDVDHIVPLKGEVVCGLHVPWNLQYLPLGENRRKKNKFEGY